jgi:xanthine/uracil permease
VKHEAAYGAIAQVLPVILLVLAVEKKWERRDREPAGVGLFFVAVVLALSLGEVLCLSALWEQRALPTIGNGLILVAIGWGLMVVAVAPMSGRIEPVFQPLNPWVAEGVKSALSLAGLVVLALFGFDVIGNRLFIEIVIWCVFAIAFVGVVLSHIWHFRKTLRETRKAG